jgi:hypothetical protein
VPHGLCPETGDRRLDVFHQVGGQHNGAPAQTDLVSQNPQKLPAPEGVQPRVGSSSL